MMKRNLKRKFVFIYYKLNYTERKENETKTQNQYYKWFDEEFRTFSK